MAQSSVVELPREGFLGGRPATGGLAASTLAALLRSPKGLLGLALVISLLGVAVFAHRLAPHDPLRQQLRLTLAQPSPAHPLGNDEFGRDMLSRLIIGSRPSLGLGVIPPLLAALIGVPLGLIAGWDRSWISMAIMRGADVILAFPGLLVAITLVAVLGPGLNTLGLGIVVFLTPGYIRIVFGEVLSLRERDFVLAARALGANTTRIVARHLLPNLLAHVIVQSSLNVATAVLAASALSFLGLGVQPPSPEWGAMISSGQKYLRSAPHVVTLPGLALMALVLGFSLLGDALRDVTDPTLKRLP